MCELFGMSCQSPVNGVAILSRFGELSASNPDGWGLAYYRDGRAIIEKEAISASESPRFRRAIQDAVSRIFIAHVRSATQGEICTENCHPFRRSAFQRDWIFAHNGTIDDIPPHTLSGGTTDSERAFLRMIDDIEAYVHRSDFHGLYPGIKHSIRRLFERYSKNITFNFLLSDGSVLYAFNHYPEKPLFVSLREREGENAIAVSTSRLKSEDFPEWKKIPEERVMLITDGRVLVLSDRL
ncbi:MAG: class II glutamine amidotransferase [Methanomicrobiales archaeon]|nr:class II glutamine amidotransferase [Methanomicrobiales archaeon]